MPAQTSVTAGTLNAICPESIKFKIGYYYNVKKILFAPHLFVSPCLPSTGIYSKKGSKRRRKEIRNKVLRMAFLLLLFFSGLREASPPTQ